MQKKFIFFCLLWLCHHLSFSQCPPPGAPVPGTGPAACNEGPLICDLNELDGYCNFTDMTGVGICPATFCGSCENYQWFAFVAGATTVELIVHVYNCIQVSGMGTGMQAMIFESDDCFNFNPIGNCESPGVETDLYVFANTIPGNVYYLMLDGWAGDLCDYEIEVISGGGQVVINPEINGPSEVCTGSIHTYFAPYYGPFTSYFFDVFPPGNGTILNQFQNSVTIQWHVPGTSLVNASVSNGCVSGKEVYTVEVFDEDQTTVDTSFCIGESLLLDDLEITGPGTYISELENTIGCDSIVTYIVSASLPVVEMVDPVFWCDTSGYVLGSDTFINSGTYTYIFPDGTADGCDSTVIFELYNLSVNAEIAVDDPLLGCTNDTLLLDGSNSGPYFDPVSGATLTYLWSGPGIIGPADTAFVEVDSAGWYTLEISYELSYGTCTAIDSVFIGQDTLITVDFMAQICEGDSYPFGGQNLTTTGFYADTLVTSNGCDSIVNLNLLVEATLETELTVSICEGESYSFGDELLTITGMYSDTLPASGGCDSIIFLDLSVQPAYQIPLDILICEGESYVVDTFIFSATGQYDVLLETTSGCDSLILLDLTVQPNSETSLSATICEGEVYSFGGVDYSQPGAYTDTLPDMIGCDSLVTLELSVFPSYTDTTMGSFCAGDSFSFAGQTFVEAGFYEVAFTTSQGCDSILFLDLMENPAFHLTESHSICPGDSILIGTTVLDEAGTYEFPGQTSEGCDSNLTVVVSVISQPPLHEMVMITACLGDSVEVNGDLYWQDTTVLDTFYYTAGCDSLYLESMLNFVPILEFEESVTICAGYSYDFQGQTFSEAGTYQLTEPLPDGCYELYTLHLDVYQASNVIIEDSICVGAEFTYDTITIDGPGAYTILVDTLGLGCPDTVTLILGELPVIELLSYEILPDNGSGTGAVYPIFGGGTPPFIYVWNPGPMSQNLENVPAGSYLLTVIDSEECFNTFGFDIPLGSQTVDLTGQGWVSLYPNPLAAGHDLQFEATGKGRDHWHVEIWDVNGICLGRREIDLRQGEDQLILPAVSGVYMLRGTNGNSFWVERIIVD